ncbi:MAG: TIGR03118 family protein [Caulobacteraceae bacterium]
MRKTRSYLTLMAAGASALVLAGCGGGGSSSSSTTAATPPASTPPASTPPTSTTPTSFQVTALAGTTAAGTVDTLAPANVASGDSTTFSFPATQNATLNPNLAGAWGVAFGPGSAVWVNGEASNMSVLLDGTGTPIPSLPSVSVPGGPTGIVANVNTVSCPTITASTCTGFNTSGFSVGGGSAEFMFASLNGNLYAWSTGTAASQVATGATGSSYTGLGIFTQSTGSTFLLAANFGAGKIDVYNSSFQIDTTNAFPGGFTDSSLPAGYAPFGVQQIGNLIYVSYAQKPTAPGPEVDGAGFGQVDVFDNTGKLLRTLGAVGGVFNAPWGMTIAPQGFGSLSGDILVGDLGDGRINVFDPNSGANLGVMMDSATGKPVQIPGLWGIAFGNNAMSQSSTVLYYAAQTDHKAQGLYGQIAVPGATTSTTTTTTNPFNY